jgi:hypothetical protein
MLRIMTVLALLFAASHLSLAQACPPTGPDQEPVSLPPSNPTPGDINRLILMAKSATRAHIQRTRPECKIMADFKAKYLGKFKVELSTWLSNDWSSPEFPRWWVYDGNSGAVTEIPRPTGSRP